MLLVLRHSVTHQQLPKLSTTENAANQRQQSAATDIPLHLNNTLLEQSFHLNVFRTDEMSGFATCSVTARVVPHTSRGSNQRSCKPSPPRVYEVPTMSRSRVPEPPACDVGRVAPHPPENATAAITTSTYYICTHVISARRHTYTHQNETLAHMRNMAVAMIEVPTSQMCPGL